MITIVRLEAQNFRSIGHAVIEPLTDGGLTAVNGPNGAGKSSLLHAVLFALYGVTPDGVPIKALRRQDSTDDVKVILTFTHDGQTVTVERGLKGLKDSHYCTISVDGRLQSIASVKAAGPWMVDRLGLDAEGFLTAFAIRQKELDGLVKALPSKRRALIERLAGIEKMSKAVQTARAEVSDTKKRLDLLPGSGADLLAARERLETAQSRAVEAWEAVEGAREAAETAEAAWAQAQESTRAMTARIEAHATAAAAATEARHAADLATERATSATAAVDRLTADADGGDPDTVAAARQRVDAATAAAQENRSARERAEQARTEVGREEQRVAAANERAARLKGDASRAAKLAKDTAAKAAQFPTDLTEQVAAADATVERLSGQVGALRGEYDRLTASLRALAATTDPSCPTCSSSLADPAALAETLRIAQDRVKADGAQAAADLKAAQDQAAALRAQQEQAVAAAREARYAQEQADTAATAAADAATEAAQAATQREHLVATAQVATAAAEAAIAAAAEVTAEVEAASTALRRAESASVALGRLAEARVAAETATTEATAARARAEEATARAVALTVPEEDKDAARSLHMTAQAEARNAAVAVERAEADHRVAAEQVIQAEKDRDVEDAKVRARAETLAEHERKQAVLDALDAFRKERIAAIAPELSETATDLIPRLTDGKFTAIELDEEFTPIVTDDQGRERPVQWLSGGEESAVALALRLALGEIIAGSAGGLLWMDEPQTAMDAARRPAMMASVRAIPGRQTIIISHVSEATDMVDLVFEVVPDPVLGSTATVASYAADTEPDLTGLDDVA